VAEGRVRGAPRQQLPLTPRPIGFPTTLAEVPGFTDAHIDRALAAAKDPKLASKLQNMPIPMTAETVDRYMRPILEAAHMGRFELIRNMT